MKVLSIILFMLLTLGFTFSLNDYIKIIIDDIETHFDFVIGVIVGVFIFLSCNLMHVWIHEHCHLIFSALFLKHIDTIYISKHNGGYVIIENPTNYLISLAPYSIPIFSIIILSLRYITIVYAHPVIDTLGGFIYGQHLVSVFKDVHLTQPDINKHGFIFSIAFIVCFNIISLSILILLMCSSSYREILSFCVISIQNVMKILSFIITRVLILF